MLSRSEGMDRKDGWAAKFALSGENKMSSRRKMSSGLHETHSKPPSLANSNAYRPLKV